MYDVAKKRLEKINEIEQNLLTYKVEVKKKFLFIKSNR